MPARSRHVVGFVKAMWVLSFSTASLALLTTFSLVVSYLSKELTSLSISHLGKLYNELGSGQDAHSLIPFVLFSFLGCCCITLLYWLRPAHDSIVMRLVECSLMRKCLGTSFEDFCSVGPAKITSRIYRSASSIRSAVSILVFDLLGSMIAILSSLRILRGIMESSTFLWFSAAFCAISALQVLLFMTLDRLKKQCVEVDDAHAEEMSGFYENFVLAKVTSTDERCRMNPLFRSDVLLRYRILLDSIRFQSILYFVALNVVVLCLSTQVRISLFSYLKEQALLVSALNNLVAKGFELESRRIEVESMKQEEGMEESSTHSLCRPVGPGAVESLDLSGVSVFLHGTPILQNICLNIAKNDRIALVGSNGSGKSTFLKFLLGFLRYSGHVRINHEVADVGTGVLRDHISYLSQNRFVEGTILDVLREVIPSDEIVPACKKFGAHRFISSLPQEYQTRVEELSRAQYQMICVIRAYFRKSSILLADEPADCLDPSDRDTVMDILLGSDRHQIKIVILHSREHLHRFDRVFVASNHTIKSYTLNAYVERANGQINASL